MKACKMTFLKIPLVLVLVGGFSLAGCTETGQRQNTGAAAGAVLGGLFGATRPGGNNLRNAAIGAAIGGAVGGAIGHGLDKQAGDIRSAVSNNEINVVNTGNELIVTMPNDILFATGSARVGPVLRSDLAALAGVMNDYPNSTINVVGHTDWVGDASFNLSLSRQRAAAVAAILRQHGVSASRIVTIGRGEDQPVATNQTAAGKQQNRRVEIIIRPNQA